MTGIKCVGPVKIVELSQKAKKTNTQIGPVKLPPSL